MMVAERDALRLGIEHFDSFISDRSWLVRLSS